MIARTQYFANCWGVFEGGGVRANAFAGAYAATAEAGISFTRVAGTSAGAVTASLIAAGATPQFAKKELESTQFRAFLLPPNRSDSPFKNPPLWLVKGRRFVSGKLRTYADLALFSGLHSSSHIQEWLEQLLKTLLEKRKPEVKHRPVQFSDLPIPLHIVAADVFHGRAHVWSREDTPLESVAFAARCSSTIPFFFQTVQRGQELFVDGGLIANMPAFVLSTIPQRNASPISERVIAFSLQDDAPVSSLIPASFGIYDFAWRLQIRLSRATPRFKPSCSQTYSACRYPQETLKQPISTL